MESFTVPAAMLKAAQVFQAKFDIRYYLNGIYLDKENGRVAGTNGHVLICCKSDKFKEMPESMIIRICGTVPASAEDADITPLDDLTGYISFRKPGGAPVQKDGARLRLFYDVIEGKFPDIDKVMPSGDPEAVDCIGVNAGYMKEVELAAKALGHKMGVIRQKFYGQSKAIGIEIYGEDNATIALMPCRI